MDKAELRAIVRAQPAVPPETSAAVVEGLFAWLSPRLPGSVTAFLAMPGEIDLTPLFDRLPGWHWLLPRVEDDRTMTFRDRDAPREMHRFGMSQPTDSGPLTPISHIDVFLAPGLAFDRRGGRVGNGAGFYDSVLVDRRADSVAVGITLESRVFDHVPVESHDQPMDLLATELGVKECSTNR